MAKIHFDIDSALPAETILAAAGDFSAMRPRYWTTIDPQVYRVHAHTATSADVTEGSAVLGGIWAREAYDLSEAGIVRARVQDSNVFQPGGIWELRATPRPGGGSHIEVLNHRQARGFKGHLLGVLMTLMGRKQLTQSLHRTLELVGSDVATGSRVATSQPA
ncbi:MAG: hypothetical protein E6J45_05470 [Chloroflexi bacterium]|nr:MAG: hypothetical protein E6J45_05470 [Chloroflexota bacterium]